MKKTLIIWLLLFASLVPGKGQVVQLIEDQKQFIGQFSGEYPLADGSFLKSRDTPLNRTIARAYLMDQIRQTGLEPMEHSYRMPNLNPVIDLLFSPFSGANVYTVISSTQQSAEYVVLGAHFDTELGCPGAIDNASGSAVIMSIAKKLTELKNRAKNVIIVFFDQEEEDLVGSQAFAKFLKDQEYTIHSVHTFDMVGWDEDGNKEMELELPTPYLEEVYLKKGGELNIPLYVTSINSTDHHSFRELGFSAVGVNEAYGKRDSSPYKDTPEDTFETVNFTYLAESTLFVFEVVKELINEGN